VTGGSRLRVGVLYGGRSGEHEVSVVSASSVVRHLDSDRYDVVPLYIDREGRWLIGGAPPTALTAAEAAGPVLAAGGDEAHLVAHPGKKTLLRISPRAERGDGSAIVSRLGLDIVFPILHGPYGEDGTIQGLLELANVPYVGSGVLGSAVSMDKAVMKTLFAAAGLPQVGHVSVLGANWRAEPDAITERVEALGYPVFVKPANLGSSIGISKVDTPEQLPNAIATALGFDRKVVVEAGVVDPREFECAVLGNDAPCASVPGEVLPSRVFYDYEAKYLDDGVRLVIPAPVSAEVTGGIQRLALDAFRAVEACGMARVDFLMSRDDGPLLVNEINTIPGFTAVSMYPKLWNASGLSYADLLTQLITHAIARHAEKQQLRTGRV
jgi:D-alanine-D-alanine ligase